MFNLLDTMGGIETTTVVLVDKPIIVTPLGLTLTNNKEIKVIGVYSVVCLVLENNIQSASRDMMDNQFQHYMQGATVNVTVTTNTNESFALPNLGQSWDMYGKIFEKNELSACFSNSCDGQPSVGSEITEIAINSFSPLPIKGIYWESTNRFDEQK